MTFSAENSLKFVNFGSFLFNLETCELKDSGIAVPLRPKAGQFLKVLIEAEGEVVSHKVLYDKIWKNSVVQRLEGLHQLARDVRNSIADDDCAVIVNVPAVGYRFAADVNRGSNNSRVPEFTPRFAYLGGLLTLPIAFLAYCLMIAAGLAS